MTVPSMRIAVIAFAALLAGCGRKEAPPSPPARPVIAPPPEPSRQSAEPYFKVESSRSLLIVRASELAVQRSANSKTLQIADRLNTDHAGIGAQLNMAGRRLNLLPPATLLPVDQMQFDGLLRATDFDTAYSRTMKAAADSCVRSHASFAERGDSPTLRPVARFAARVCADEMNLFP